MKKWWMLTEEEINKDLRKNLVELKVSLDDIVNEANELRYLERKEIISNYSCGYHLREFISKEGFISFSEREILPIIFSFAKVPCVYMLYDIVTTQRGARGLSGLEKMNVIEVAIENTYRTTYKINDYKTIEKGLLNHFLKHKENKKELKKIISNNLGLLKNKINDISRDSSYIHNEFKKWFKKEKKNFKSNPYRILRDFIKNKFLEEKEEEVLISYDLG